METDMKKLICICLAFVIMVSGLISVAATSISELEEQKAELEKQQAEYQEKLDKSNSAVKDQQETVDALVGKVQSVSEEIVLINKKIELLDKQITTKQTEIDKKNNEIETNMNTLRQRIKTIYISGDVSSLEIILGAKDFSDFLDKLQLVQYVSNHDEKLISEIKGKLDTIAKEKKELQDAKDQKVTDRQSLKTKQDELNTLLNENKETLESLQLSADDAKMNLTMTDEELSSLDEKIQEHYRQQAAEEAARAAAAAAAAATESEDDSSSDSGSSESSDSSSDDSTITGGDESSSDGSEGSGDDSTIQYEDVSVPSNVESDGSWVWPTPGYHTLTSQYGEGRSYETHNAVDIGAPTGTPIYAANSGTVVSSCSTCSHYSSWCSCGGGYGNFIWILHDNGYETIYGHMSSTAVSTGSVVSAGQLIGYVGSTGWSTGPHLHFELRIGGVKSNPMDLY